MGFFNYDEDSEMFRGELSGVIFVCEDIEDGYEESARKLAESYGQKLPEIADFILPDIREMFGGVTKEKLTESLGRPLIDLDSGLLTYLDHTLDNTHIIEIEFSGIFDKFLSISIDG